MQRTSRSSAWRRAGLTLMELLAVSGLIVLLAALLLPVLARVRERVWQVGCLSHVQQITKAHLLYLQDWDERFPDWYLPGPPRPAPYGARVFWPERLQPYLRSDAVLRDPGAVWDAQEDERLADYALMTSGPGGQGNPEEPYWRWPGPPLSLAAIERPSETVFLVDGWTTTGWQIGPISRHCGGESAGFMDGHALWLPMRELRRVDTDGRGFYWFHYAAADR
jgi:hypothetical protein